MIPLAYDPELVEEAVLLAEPSATRADARAFRRDRDRIYDIADADEREVRFRSLHLLWFGRFGLHRPIEHAIREVTKLCAFAGEAGLLGACSGFLDTLLEGRVVCAMTRREEGADLIDTSAGESTTRPMLVLRLRPAAFGDPPALLDLLRHELMHVSDMLDPAFGYQRALPPSDGGPSHDNILRDRYRVLWDVTIDGRLARAGLLSEDRVRAARRQEFADTFRLAPGAQCQDAFDEWFDRTEPSHAALVAFAMREDADRPAADNIAGRCPVCRFPVATLDPRPERLSADAQAAIRSEHSAWTIEQGLCSQCLDLFEARSAEAHHSDTASREDPLRVIGRLPLDGTGRAREAWPGGSSVR